MTMLIFSTIQAFVLFSLGAIAILAGVVVLVLAPIMQRDERNKLTDDELEPATPVLIKIKSDATPRAIISSDPATAFNHPDMAARHREQVLTEERIDYRQIVENMEQIVFKTDGDGNISMLNSSWENLLDYTIADSLNRPFDTFVHPEDRPVVDAQIGGLLRGNRDTCRIEMRMIARNNTSRWLDLRVRSINGSERAIIGTLTDINQQKEIEARLRAVRRSLSTLLNSIPGMVYRCKSDRNWGFEFASDGCLEVTGYEPYHLVNDPNLYFQHIMFPDDRDYAWNHVNKQVMLKRNFQLIYRIIDRSGQVKWIWEQGRGVYSAGGELLALEGFIRVIAEDSAKARTVLEGFHDLIMDDTVPS